MSDHLYAVTFAGIVVEVCGTQREADDAASTMMENHPEAAISVMVLA
jgi:hypothetical protein